MHDKEILPPQEFYSAYLQAINNVRFTRRQVDVIACLLKGRDKAKEIGSFLSISEHTIRTHLQKIRERIKGRSLIDFVESSAQEGLLKKHYLFLQIHSAFHNCLKDIQKSTILKGSEALGYLIIHWKSDPHNLFVEQLESDLRLLKIPVSRETRDIQQDFQDISGIEHNKFTIYIVSNDFIKNYPEGDIQNVSSLKKCLFLMPPRKTNSKEYEIFKNIAHLDLSQQKNYYFSFFLLLQKINPTVNFDKVITEFEQKYSVLKGSDSFAFTTASKTPHLLKFQDTPALRRISLGVITFMVTLSGGIYYWNTRPNNTFTVRSDLVIPTGSALLHRPEIIEQINEKFKGTSGIQTVALIGPGGAGKTTLARQYIHQQKAGVVWEIKAESHESITLSFEYLAKTLAKTEEDQKLLREIQTAKTPAEREEKVIQFVKERLRLRAGWLLIYDNMEKFEDIQRYFPQDIETWGQGKVILTTRDANVQNNKRVNAFVQIGELTPNQKFDLFIKIMKQEKAGLTPVQIKEIKQFLEDIPPFPLDVSIAGYYIKATNVSYARYLEYLQKYYTDFDNVQKNLLKETGDYTRTRYTLITLSLQHLINQNEDFKDLLLFISLLNSQNIPKELLEKHKNSVVVDNFIYHLKKYSLITDESSLSSSNPSFTIHHSTQSICLSYLTKLLKLETNYHTFSTIAAVLDDYIDEMVCKDDIDKMKSLVKHYESLLSHNSLLTNDIRGSLETDLGYIYSSMGYFTQAKQMLENGLKNLSTNNNNYGVIARNLVCQGWINSLFNNYDHAKKLLEQSLIIYMKNAPSKKKERARALVYLGDIYRWTGNYEKAKNLLEDSLFLYKETASEAHTAMALSCLGHVYEELGQYERSISLLEQNINFCKKHLTEDSTRQAWGLLHLGKTYTGLGCYSKAADLVDQSIFILKKHFPKNHGFISMASIMLGKIRNEQGDLETAKDLLELSIKNHKNFGGEWHTTYAWGLESLGDVYRKLGNYEKAKQLLYESIVIFEKQGGKDHLKTASPLRSLGQVYLCEGHLEEAEVFLQKSLKILQDNNHPQSYATLEVLSELYLNKAFLQKDQKDLQQYTKLKNQAFNYLKEALSIVKNRFPEDSPHVARIQAKLNSLLSK